MCDILHNRQVKMFYRFDPFFTLSGMRKQSKELIGIIHGLTKKVRQSSFDQLGTAGY